MANTFVTIDFMVTVMSDDTCTVAHLKDAQSDEILAAGSAKRHPKDSPDGWLGVNLAVARALRQWADVAEADTVERMTK